MHIEQLRWIPACAGMTRLVICIVNHHGLNNQLD